jgi:hypothetical protein
VDIKPKDVDLQTADLRFSPLILRKNRMAASMLAVPAVIPLVVYRRRRGMPRLLADSSRSELLISDSMNCNVQGSSLGAQPRFASSPQELAYMTKPCPWPRAAGGGAALAERQRTLCSFWTARGF